MAQEYLNFNLKLQKRVDSIEHFSNLFNFKTEQMVVMD